MAPERFPQFERCRLKLTPLAERAHNFTMQNLLPLKPSSSIREAFRNIGSKILSAQKNKAAAILMMGAHVLRAGVQRHLIDMMEKGRLSCIGMNGAGVIHDYEMALIGKTTESVANYIQNGRFGLWQETGKINELVAAGAKEELGLGEAMGRAIEEGRLPHRAISILAAGYRYKIPVTVHVGIGYDIVFQFPNCDGAAYGAASYKDFLRFAKILESLEGGVVMNFGSAVMGPEVFLKALAMVRNVACQEGRQICKFTSLVCDLKELPEDHHHEVAPDHPDYYFRPWKTLLLRTVAGGGESYYVRGHHAQTIPELWTAIESEAA